MTFMASRYYNTRMKEIYREGDYTLQEDTNGSINFYHKQDWCSRELTLEGGIETIQQIIEVNKINKQQQQQQ